MLAWLAILFFIALGGAIVFFILARSQQERTGLPFGSRVVYADTGAWEKVEKPMFSRRYVLAGKPDYIVEDSGVIIPVEVKPNRVALSPRESDVMQLMAYGLLIEETLGQGRVAPRYGLLKYRDAVFQVDFTDELRAELIDLMETIRRDASRRDVPRSHEQAQRCRACGYRSECEQALE